MAISLMTLEEGQKVEQMLYAELQKICPAYDIEQTKNARNPPDAPHHLYNFVFNNEKAVGHMLVEKTGNYNPFRMELMLRDHNSKNKIEFSRECKDMTEVETNIPHMIAAIKTLEEKLSA
ncbi:MAG: hypothetical protein AABY01_03310 [Nanoarchaeota archaeon]